MFNQPRLEAVKEVLRLALLFVISWVISETLRQISLVPVVYDLHVWVFVYTIPVQALVAFALTFVGRYIDKYVFEKNKLKYGEDKGVIPF